MDKQRNRSHLQHCPECCTHNAVLISGGQGHKERMPDRTTWTTPVTLQCLLCGHTEERNNTVTVANELLKDVKI